MVSGKGAEKQGVFAKSGKSVERKKFIIATFTLIGAVIGAGILGLPYVFAKSGFTIGIFWLVVLGLILTYCKLCFGEVTLRTKKRHQLTGYAEKYLGKIGKNFAIFSMFFGIYSALLAYLIAEGESLSLLFTQGKDYAIIFGIGFWFLLTALLQDGLRGLKKVESRGVLIVILIIFGLFLWFLPGVKLTNLSFIEPRFFFIPLGVTLFALLGFTAIPELRIEVQGAEKVLKKSILYGSLVPVLLYALFSLTFVGVFGKEVSEVATLSAGGIAIALGIFTMFTCYFILSFALRDMIIYDLQRFKKYRFLLVSLIPLLIYIAVNLFNLADFVVVLGIGGIVSGTITGSLVLLMNLKAKILGDRKPEYSMPISKGIIAILILIFVFGLVVELFF